MSALSWLAARLSERTSQAALAYALSTVTSVLQGQATWQAATPVLLGGLLTILVPEASSVPPPTAGRTPANP